MAQCKAMTRHSDQCWHTAVKDTDFCWRHTPDYKTPLQRCQAENAKLKEKLKQAKLLCEWQCPACGETIYFHQLRSIRYY